MSIQLDWQIQEEEERPGDIGRRPRRPSGGWLIVVVVGGLLFGGWQFSQQRLAEATVELQEAAQAILDMERQAVLGGDGDLFWSVQVDDPAWLSAQRRPEQLAATRAGLSVARVETHGQEVWANLTWRENERTWQKAAFFQWQGGRLLHGPPAADYWGQMVETPTRWGKLVYYEADQPWAEAIARFVEGAIAGPCRPDCPGQRPLTLTIAPDFALTAAPGQLRFPSPRLIALDEQGQPANAFWHTLHRQLWDYLAPAVIRFAVPGHLASRYQRLAADFAALYPYLQVQIVTLPGRLDDLATWLVTNEVDGAALAPTEAMIAAGLVYDLTDLARSDWTFDQADFYEQIWQGTWWRGRLWFMPETAKMPLLFYDRESYQQVGRAEPTPAWTWADLTQDVTALAANQSGRHVLWSFLDSTNNALFAYAFAVDNPCLVRSGSQCYQPLQPAQVAAALAWYREVTGRPGQMPDLTTVTPEERDYLALNWVAPRRVVLWVDEPLNYEFHLLRQPLGVVTFPGDEQAVGVTPLRVQGSFISRSSERPLATWQWLKFLSYQLVEREARLVPARPSVALHHQYWLTLPEPLGPLMREAFPLARPVTIADQGYFTWEQLAAVVSGRLTPVEAASLHPAVRWFSGN
ncbi:MAG: ABC transporter substrate-binding protein [Chloroflexota bacterium]